MGFKLGGQRKPKTGGNLPDSLHNGNSPLHQVTSNTKIKDLPHELVTSAKNFGSNAIEGVRKAINDVGNTTLKGAATSILSGAIPEITLAKKIYDMSRKKPAKKKPTKKVPAKKPVKKKSMKKELVNLRSTKIKDYKVGSKKRADEYKRRNWKEDETTVGSKKKASKYNKI